jgi:hypothetical protein
VAKSIGSDELLGHHIVTLCEEYFSFLSMVYYTPVGIGPTRAPRRFLRGPRLAAEYEVVQVRQPIVN